VTFFVKALLCLAFSKTVWLRLLSMFVALWCGSCFSRYRKVSLSICLRFSLFFCCLFFFFVGCLLLWWWVLCSFLLDVLGRCWRSCFVGLGMLGRV
jgi:hypothetical protein